jgi:hypothetical protein
MSVSFKETLFENGTMNERNESHKQMTCSKDLFSFNNKKQEHGGEVNQPCYSVCLNFFYVGTLVTVITDTSDIHAEIVKHATQF